MKKILIIIFLLSITLEVYAVRQQVIVKANIVRGESFVTANVLSDDIEQVLKNALMRMNYSIVETIHEAEDLLYFDAFIFQYPADYPTVVLTVRSKKGIHHVDKESIKLFGNRKAANIKITKEIAARIPYKINTDRYFRLTIEDILCKSRVSLTGSVSGLIMKEYRADYLTVIKWPEDESPVFILPNDFDIYLSYCIDY